MNPSLILAHGGGSKGFWKFFVRIQLMRLHKRFGGYLIVNHQLAEISPRQQLFLFPYN